MMPSHTYEIERIEWLLANGYPKYALWRLFKLLVRQRKEFIALKYNQAIVYTFMYRRHIWPEYSIREQVVIIWDFFVADRFTRPDGGDHP